MRTESEPYATPANGATVDLRTRLAGFWALLHPGPSLLTVVAFILCAFIAAGGHPSLGRLTITALGMVCMQFSISALNDYCDREADALSQHKRKPIPLGLVSPRFALVAALVLAVVMFTIYLPFGFAPTLFAAIFLGLGFAYDLGVKSTPFSGVMHGLAFPTIPLLAWSLFDHLRPELFTVFPLGMALGVGIHLADAIPDAEADAAAGVRGMTQVFGSRALVVCWGAFAVAQVIVLALAMRRENWFLDAPFLLSESLAIGALLAAIVLYRNDTLLLKVRFQMNFYCLVASALLTTIAWFTVVIA